MRPTGNPPASHRGHALRRGIQSGEALQGAPLSVLLPDRAMWLMTSETDGVVAGAALVRIVPAELGEGFAGVLVGLAADVLVLSTVDDLRLSGTAGRIQISGVVVLTLLWAINLVVYRPRQLRAFGSAVTVEESSLPEG